MKYNWILLLTGLLLVPFCLGAQSASKVVQVRSSILDSISRRPVVYATIHLVNESGVSRASGYSGEDGAFMIRYGITAEDAGKLFLLVSCTGFEDKKIPVPLQEDAAVMDIPGPVLLHPVSRSMEEVTVRAVKKIIDVQPGKIVYNAENDVTNKGGTAADVLRKAPVLNVDGQGNVSMRGSANLKILIDGKYSGQIARSPADALNMMPADIVKAVEVITTPSAKYDAEGAAGIINIITKKNSRRFSGALEMAAGNREQVLNPRIAITNAKWSFSLHGHLHRLRSKEAAFTERMQEDGNRLYQEQYQDNHAPHGSGDMALIYSPDERTEWSLGVNYWLGKWPDNSQIDTRLYLPDGSLAEAYNQTIDRKESYLGADINLGYNKKFKKNNREITVLVQLTPSGSRAPYFSSSFYPGTGSLYGEQNNNTVKNKEWTVQADYSHPFNRDGNYILETGVKAILRNVRNRYEVFTIENDQPPVPDADRSDLFTYRQYIGAAYALFKAKWEQHWYAETGLRYERTDIQGQFEQKTAVIENQFDNLIPTLNLSKRLNEQHQLGLTYTQRITRPYIWDLNPNANASDPKNIQTGNPELKPEMMYQTELTYGLQISTGYFINTALFWKRTSNAIVDFTEIVQQGISITRKENMASNSVYGLNMSASVRPNAQWSINGNLNLNYLNYTNNAWQVFNRGWASDVNVNTTCKLPRNYSLQLFGAYDTRKVTLQGYETPVYYYVLAVRKELASPKIAITVTTTNPFSKYVRQTKYLSAPSFSTTAAQRDYLQGYRVTFNWEFGNNQKEKNIKKVKNDDVNNATKM